MTRRSGRDTIDRKWVLGVIIGFRLHLNHMVTYGCLKGPQGPEQAVMSTGCVLTDCRSLRGLGLRAGSVELFGLHYYGAFDAWRSLAHDSESQHGAHQASVAGETHRQQLGREGGRPRQASSSTFCVVVVGIRGVVRVAAVRR